VASDEFEDLAKSKSTSKEINWQKWGTIIGGLVLIVAMIGVLVSLSLLPTTSEPITSESTSTEESGITSGDESGIASGDESGIASGDESGIASGDESGITSGDESGITSGDELEADLIFTWFYTSEGFKFNKSTEIPPFKFEVPASIPFYYYSVIENLNKDFPVSNVCVTLEILNKKTGIFLNLTKHIPKFHESSGITLPILPDIPPIVCVEFDELATPIQIAHPIKLDTPGIHLSYHTVTYYDKTLKIEITHEKIMNELIAK